MAQEKRFRNYYYCPCGVSWTDEWSATCDDRCPKYDMSCSPHLSNDIGGDAGEPPPITDVRNRYERFAWRDCDIEIHEPSENQGDSDAD